MCARYGDLPPHADKPVFATTHWSVVLAAGEHPHDGAHKALTRLCETYWYPLYAFVRRRVTDAHEAQDLTQAFFSHLIEKGAVARAQPDRGRFRAFLLTALKNFLSNEWHKAHAQHRGGGRTLLSLDFEAAESRWQFEPAHDLSPDRIYERRWVLTLLDNVLENLRQELAASGHGAHFEQFAPALTDQMTRADYEQAAQKLGITPAAAKQAAYRMRKRYHALFRQEVAQTIAPDEDLDDEIRRLLAILS